MHLYIFHYHLLPGGVTTVIRDGARALLAHRNLFPGLDRLVVVAGGDDGGGLGAPVERCRLDAAGYDDAPATAAGQRRLADCCSAVSGTGCGGSTTITWPRTRASRGRCWRPPRTGNR